MSVFARITIVAIGLFATWPSVATASDVNDPQSQQRSFKVAEGFEVNLFASEPMIAKPIQMNWDAAGRLWVASSSQYPQIKPGEAPADKVIILEDTDADGRADKSTVFADDLLIPTGVAPAALPLAEAYVANSTELLHLKDTDGDGKADQRRVVLSGFGTEDTHHLIHTFRWGFDGRLHFNQAIYIHSHVETPHGTRRLMGSGTWRFCPETSQLDIVMRGMVNPWGHAQDEWGNSFQTDGAGDGGVHYVFPGAAFPSAVGIDRTLAGLNPGSPKFCGLEIASGRHLPDDWQGNAITCDFRANRVVRFRITDENGSFVSRQMPDVITSTDVAFRPIDVQVGPDGAIYLADWYNPIINHGEVDFRDPRRDKTRGRIWRITATGRPLVPKPKLLGVPVTEVLEQLKSPEGWTRRQAKLVLARASSPRSSTERGNTERMRVPQALAAWLAKLDPSDPLRERHRLEALWLYQSLDVPAPKLLGELLESKSSQARAAATRVIGDWIDRLPDAIDLLANRVADDNPRVRLEAVRGLARIGTPRAVEIAMTALDRPRDANLDFALWLTAKETEAAWMPAYQSGALRFNDNAAHAAFALQAVRSPEAAALLAGQLRGGTLPPAERGNALELIAGAGGPDELRIVYDLATAENPDAVALAAVEKAIRNRNVLPASGDPAKLAPLIGLRRAPSSRAADAAADEAVRIAAIKLAGAWRAQVLRDALAKLAEDPATTLPVRRAALAALADFGGASAELLRQLDAPGRSFDERVIAVVALAAVDLNDAAARAADLLAAAPDKADPAPLVAGVIQRSGGGKALAQALAGKKLAPHVAALALRHLETTGRDEAPLAQRFRDAGGVAAPTTASLSRAEMAARVAQVQRYGDAARGEMLFRRADTGCFKCHAIGGAGGQLGPDLSSIGASSPVDYLIESMLEPNKAIKDGYDSIIVTTTGNDVHSGIKVSQDDKQLVLRDAVADRIVIPLEKIKSQRPGGSLMPTGLVDALPSWAQLDLLRFLCELGKPGPYGATSPLIVRRWRVLPPDAAAKLAADPAPLAAADRAAALPWTPAYSLVSGVLPPDALAADGQPIAFARAEIEVTTPGKVGLHIGQTRGLALWLDGSPLELSSELAFDLAAGVRALTFRIDVAERGEGLRVEVRDLPNSPAHARPVGGR